MGLWNFEALLNSSSKHSPIVGRSLVPRLDERHIKIEVVGKHDVLGEEAFAIPKGCLISPSKRDWDMCPVESPNSIAEVMIPLVVKLLRQLFEIKDLSSILP